MVIDACLYKVPKNIQRATTRVQELTEKNNIHERTSFSLLKQLLRVHLQKRILAPITYKTKVKIFHLPKPFYEEVLYKIDSDIKFKKNLLVPTQKLLSFIQLKPHIIEQHTPDRCPCTESFHCRHIITKGISSKNVLFCYNENINVLVLHFSIRFIGLNGTKSKSKG